MNAGSTTASRHACALTLPPQFPKSGGSKGFPKANSDGLVSRGCGSLGMLETGKQVTQVAKLTSRQKPTNTAAGKAEPDAGPRGRVEGPEWGGRRRPREGRGRPWKG